jgi:hypothetical protein
MSGGRALQAVAYSYGTDMKHDKPQFIMVFSGLIRVHSCTIMTPDALVPFYGYKGYGAKLLDHLGAEPLSSRLYRRLSMYHLIQRTSTSSQWDRSQTPYHVLSIGYYGTEVVVELGNIYATEKAFICQPFIPLPASHLSYDQVVVL